MKWELLGPDDAYDPEDDSATEPGISPDGIRQKAELRKVVDFLMANEMPKILARWPKIPSPPGSAYVNGPDGKAIPQIGFEVSDDVDCKDPEYGVWIIDLRPAMRAAGLTDRSCLAEDVAFVLGCELVELDLHDKDRDLDSFELGWEGF